jgi:hypothetical protein
MTQANPFNIFVRKPRLIVRMDSQQLGAIERCPREFQLSFMENLEPKQKGAALGKGSCISNALEAYYQGKIDGKPFGECVLAGIMVITTAELRDEKDASSLEIRTLILEKFAKYCNHYRNENIIPVSAEKGFSKTLYSDDDVLIIYEGKPDLTFHTGDFKITPMDHKSEARHNNLHAFRNQFMGYVWYLESPILVINYFGLQRSMKPEESFRRDFCKYSKADIEDWRHNVIINMQDIFRFQKENYYPKRRSACKGEYGMCYLHKICDETHPWKIQQAKESFYKIREQEWSAWR